MTAPDDLLVIHVDQQDPRLGRYVVHDPRSRAFPLTATVDTSTWRNRSIGIYDPRPNPVQVIGNCTGCDKAMEANAIGNRVKGRVLDMAWATECYSRATRLDPFAGEWPPDDTGSYGLAACKAAQDMGVGGAYRHIFDGADGVVQAIMEGETVGIGVWWYEGMFTRRPWTRDRHRIEVIGRKVGGHQLRARGFDAVADMVQLRCWWGDYRDVWLPRQQLDDLLLDNGDAHTQHVRLP